MSLARINKNAQYGPYAIPAKLMPHVAAILQVWSVKMQSLLCYRAHLSLIIFLTLIMSLRYCSMWPIYNTIQDNAMLHLFCKFVESKCNPYYVIVLTS